MPYIEQQPGATSARVREIRDNSSARILLVGDIHMRDRPPSSTTETYQDDLLDMLEYVAKLGKAIDAVTVWAGDIFDQKLPSRTSHTTILKMERALKKFHRPVRVVVGNHDISADVLESTYEKQPLGVLIESGLAWELNQWDEEDLPIFGVPWQQRWQHQHTPANALMEWRDALDDRPAYVKKSLVVTHAPIYPLGQELEFEFVPTAGPDGLSAAMGNVGSLYYGHIHEPHGIFKVSGVTYANFGAMSRGSLTEYNVNRRIQVGLWTPEHGFTALDIPHKPAVEVFRMKEVLAKREEKVSLDNFLAEVGQSVLDNTSIPHVIDHIKGLEHIEPPVKAKAISFLEEVDH